MLKWIGNLKGAEGIIGIPARDLTKPEVSQFGGEKELIATGLYEKEATAKPEPEVARKLKPPKPAEEDN